MIKALKTIVQRIGIGHKPRKTNLRSELAFLQKLHDRAHSTT